MATDAKNQELKAAEDKYYRDRATLMRIFGARSLDCEWLIERKYGAYVATKCRSGFQVYGKSMREIIAALRLAKVKITQQVKFINHDQAERWKGGKVEKWNKESRSSRPAGTAGFQPLGTSGSPMIRNFSTTQP